MAQDTIEPGFVSPQLAKPLKDFDPTSDEWFAEEKYDGHRIVVAVSDRKSSLFDEITVRGWSRQGLERLLPPHIREALAELPPGVYDGELLVPGERSYGTVVLENSSRLIYFMFDILNLLGRDVTTDGIGATYLERRRMLLSIFAKTPAKRGLQLAWHEPVLTDSRIRDLSQQVWDSDGEGLILKSASGLYHPGKRSNDWRKIKQLQTAVLTVTGFRRGKLGPNSVVCLRNEEDGCETTVKWKNFDELDRIDADPDSFVGRKLRIEFQERTADGSYRHPRWDRWENE